MSVYSNTPDIIDPIVVKMSTRVSVKAYIAFGIAVSLLTVAVGIVLSIMIVLPGAEDHPWWMFAWLRYLSAALGVVASFLLLFGIGEAINRRLGSWMMSQKGVTHNSLVGRSRSIEWCAVRECKMTANQCLISDGETTIVLPWKLIDADRKDIESSLRQMLVPVPTENSIREDG